MTKLVEHPRIVIIGGGITGISCALRFQTLAREARTPCDITVLEGGESVGGKLKTDRVGDFIVDGGPDIFLGNKRPAIALCESLGIMHRVQPTNPATRVTYVRRGATLHTEPMYQDLPLVTPRGGMQELVDTAAHALTDGRIVTRARVMSIGRDGDTYVMTTGTGERYRADAVVVATPAPSAARLFDAIAPAVSYALRTIPYTAMTTVSFAFRTEDVPHDLHGYGYIVADAKDGDVTACTWTSSKIEGRAPAGHVLLRGYVRSDDDSAPDRILAEIRTTLGITAEPVFTRAYRWKEGVPLYTPDHAATVAAIRAHLAELPAIALAGGALDGAGIPDSIGSATTAADTLWPLVTHAHISSV